MITFHKLFEMLHREASKCNCTLRSPEESEYRVELSYNPIRNDLMISNISGSPVLQPVLGTITQSASDPDIYMVTAVAGYSNISVNHCYNGASSMEDQGVETPWWEILGLTEELRQSFFTLVNLYIYEDPGVIMVPRPSFMTFGDFANFCASVYTKRDWYGVYRPVKDNIRCFRIYEKLDQVNYTHYIDKFPMAQCMINFWKDSVAICKCGDSSIVVDQTTRRVFLYSEPFAFYNNDGLAVWAQYMKLPPEDQSFIADTVRPFYEGKRIW